MGNNVGHQDEETARKHGVILEITPDSPRYLSNRAEAKCTATGMVIRSDNVVWIRSELARYKIPIIEEVYFG